jgi:long-chain fatty acid transport protein
MRRRGFIHCRFKLFAVVFALLALLGSSVAEATNGYLIHGIGTRAKGLAGAGVALPQDALAAATNPAGMAYVGKRYDVGLAVFNPNREYTISGDPSGFPDTFGLVPGTVESDSEYFFVPNFGANWQLANSTLGLAIYGQGGMNTDWPTATFFGSSPTGVDFSQLYIMLPWAAKTARGRHAIGIAPILAYQQFEVEGIEAFGNFSIAPDKLTNNGRDDSTGFGGRLGYLGQWTDRFSVGLAYQFEIDMDEFDDYAGLFAGEGDFDIQENWVAGIAYRFSDTGTFVLDYQEIFYSDIPNVGNPFSNLLPPQLGGTGPAPLGDINGPGFGWEDMSIVKVGLQWGSQPWTWRLGFSTGDQPIPETEVLFNILAPGVMEEHITLGFSRRLQKGEINFALMHAPSVSVTGPNPLEAPGQQQIELEMDQWDLELGYSWGF